MDMVLALHAGSRGFDSHRGHMSERFFRSNRPGYSHPVSSELENSGIGVAVGDCSETVHVQAKHYKHNEDGGTAPCVRQWFRTAEPLGVENRNTHTNSLFGGTPDLVDKVFAFLAGSREFDSHRRHMSERLSDPIDQDIRTQCALNWKNSTIRVAVGDCSVSERRRRRPPYQTGKTVHVHYNRCMAPGVRGPGSEPLHHSREVVTRNGLYAHIDSLISASEYAEDLVTKFTSLIGQWTNSPKHRSW